jgi:hypothetical protein
LLLVVLTINSSMWTNHVFVWNWSYFSGRTAAWILWRWYSGCIFCF